MCLTHTYTYKTSQVSPVNLTVRLWTVGENRTVPVGNPHTHHNSTVRGRLLSNKPPCRAVPWVRSHEYLSARSPNVRLSSYSPKTRAVRFTGETEVVPCLCVCLSPYPSNDPATCWVEIQIEEVKQSNDMSPAPPGGLVGERPRRTNPSGTCEQKPDDPARTAGTYQTQPHTSFYKPYKIMFMDSYVFCYMTRGGAV